MAIIPTQNQNPLNLAGCRQTERIDGTRMPAHYMWISLCFFWIASVAAEIGYCKQIGYFRNEIYDEERR